MRAVAQLVLAVDVERHARPGSAAAAGSRPVSRTSCSSKPTRAASGVARGLPRRPHRARGGRGRGCSARRPARRVGRASSRRRRRQSGCEERRGGRAAASDGGAWHTGERSLRAHVAWRGAGEDRPIERPGRADAFGDASARHARQERSLPRGLLGCRRGAPVPLAPRPSCSAVPSRSPISRTSRATAAPVALCPRGARARRRLAPGHRRHRRARATRRPPSTASTPASARSPRRASPSATSARCSRTSSAATRAASAPISARPRCAR